MGSKKKTLDDYKKLARDRGIKYILNTIPRNTQTKAENAWICKEGHIWSTPYNNIKGTKNRIGTGCPHCARNVPKNLDDYKSLARSKGFEYILNDIPKNTGTKAINAWKCKNDHIWSSRYNDIYNNRKCSICAPNFPKTINDYKNIAKLMGIEYILDTIPNNIYIIVENAWKCNEGHILSRTYHNVYSGNGCRVCSNKELKTINDYKNLALSRNFEYILDYIPNTTNNNAINGWRCEKGHVWSTSYNNIRGTKDIGGSGCPNCRYKSEQCARTILENIFEYEFPKARPSWLKGLELDGYNESLKLAFEYQGIQHEEFHPHFHRHGKTFEKQVERDKRKKDLCDSLNIKLIIIPSKYTYRNKNNMKVYIESQISLLTNNKPIIIFEDDS